jgi:peptidoglycan/xylan/chitin deacetylase (PgdA/CDA1 family)
MASTLRTWPGPVRGGNRRSEEANVVEMSDLLWPGGRRVAVVFNIAFESWSPGAAPGIGPMGNPLQRPGVLDTQAVSWAGYGPRRGIWRLMDILDRHETSATVMTSGILAESFPEAVRELADRGHDVCAHSYAQDILPAYLSEAEERDHIKRCTELLRDATSKAPRGWMSPRGTPSPNTARLLAEAGYSWHGDCFDEDVPYVESFGSARIVAVPFTMEVNDMPLHVRHGNPPQTMLQVFEDTFERVCASEEMALSLDVTVHAHVFGRPAGAWVYERILEQVRRRSDVWVATRSQVADHVLSAGT